MNCGSQAGLQGKTAGAYGVSKAGVIHYTRGLASRLGGHGINVNCIAPGYTGPLYAEICPRSFSVLVRPGMRLNQIRFRRGHAALDDQALHALHATCPLVSGAPVISEGLGFSVDLKPASTTLVGYRAKPHTGVIDLDQIAGYDAADYWEEVHTTNGRIILDPGAFYILVSREAVTIPPGYAAEMAPFMAMLITGVFGLWSFRIHLDRRARIARIHGDGPGC